MKTLSNHKTKNGFNFKNQLKGLALIFLTSLNSLAQNNESGIWVTVKNPSIISKHNGRFFSNDAAVQNAIQSLNITDFKQAVPSSRNPELQKVYEINCNCDENDLLYTFSKLQNNFSKPELAPKYETLDIPNDYSLAFPNDWALNLINAPQAWDITHGDTNIVVAITDANYIVNHEELVGKINYVTPYNSNGNYAHGTAVATIVGGNTNNGIGKSAIGYNTHLALQMMNYNEVLNAAYAGRRIINMSWASSCYFSSYGQSIIDEAYNAGCILIAAAGNGGTCGGANNLVFPAAFNHVIAVSSVGEFDNHEGVIGDPTSCHQHNSSVDICAPGYNVPLTAGSNWYLTANGTSFASPHVSGTVALMLSVNPCLSFEEVEYILKQTAVNIDALNPSYAGLLGAGRLDAGAAVAMAAQFTTLEMEYFTGVGCSVESGYASVNVLDGVGNITYFWSTGDTTQAISNIAGGSYQITAIDELGCLATATVNVPLYTNVIVGQNIQNITCHDLNDGAINIHVSGGMPSYTYLWNNGSTEEDIDSLTEGTYRVTITDSLGCVVFKSYTITNPTNLNVTENSTFNLLTNKGNASLNISGGTPEYQVNWSNGDVSNEIIQVNPGTYHYTVTDANGCSFEDSIVFETFSVDGNGGLYTNQTSGTQSTMGIENNEIMIVEVYPNPVKNNEVIYLSNTSTNTVKVTNLNGQTMFESNNSKSIAVNGWSTGVYFVSINDKQQGLITKKIIIE